MSDPLKKLRINKDGAKKIVSGGGKDISDLMARAIFRADQEKAAEGKGGYPVYDQYGNVAGYMTPGQGLRPVAGAAPTFNPSPGPSALPMGKSLGSSSRSGPSDFRSIGKTKSLEQAKSEQQDAALNEFLKSATTLEIENLRGLAKDRIILEKSKIEEIHGQGQEVGVERLIELELVKWAQFDGMCEFRITSRGRQVLDAFTRG